MAKHDITLRGVSKICKINNLMMFIDEDILKFLIFKMFQQLAILREAGAAHGDVKPENIMFSFDADTETTNLDSADVHLIDFGCSGPDGVIYGGALTGGVAIYGCTQIF